MEKKKLELRFLTTDKSTLKVSVTDPKEDMSAEAVKTAAEKIAPVLMNLRGATVASFDKAYIVKTTVEEVQ